MATLTPEASRAGRAILKWSIVELSKQAAVASSTVYLLERGENIRAATATAIIEAFARQGVEITNGKGTGARLRRS